MIAYGAGGLCDSVRCLDRGDRWPTGLLFPEQTPTSLAAAWSISTTGSFGGNYLPAASVNGPRVLGRSASGTASRRCCRTAGTNIATALTLAAQPPLSPQSSLCLWPE